MAEGYLTTDIIVIIVLVVVLVIIGLCAFLIHFYWTKIGVSEIWNTPKWSSMRSSFYRTINRFSQGSTSKSVSEQPLSGMSIYSGDIHDVSLKNKKPDLVHTSYVIPSNNYLNQPVYVVAYNNPVRQNYATKIGQPIESTKIHNIHEYNNRDNDPSIIIEKRF